VRSQSCRIWRDEGEKLKRDGEKDAGEEQKTTKDDMDLLRSLKHE